MPMIVTRLPAGTSASKRVAKLKKKFEDDLGGQSAYGPRASAIARKLEWLSERRGSGRK